MDVRAAVLGLMPSVPLVIELSGREHCWDSNVGATDDGMIFNVLNKFWYH